MVKICNRKELSGLIQEELNKRNKQLNSNEFQNLLRYTKNNNQVGINKYNCSFVDITVDCWLNSKNSMLYASRKARKEK